MKNHKQFQVGLVFLSLFVFALSAASATDLSGTWVGEIDIPDYGIDEITLVLKKDGSSYTGTIVDTLGFWPEGSEIEDVEIDGNLLTFSTNIMNGSMLIIFRLTVEGDKMTGEVENATMGGSVPITLEKKDITQIQLWDYLFNYTEDAFPSCPS